MKKALALPHADGRREARSTVARSVYPQRPERPAQPLDDWVRQRLGPLRHRLQPRIGWLRHIADAAAAQRPAAQALDDTALQARLPALARQVWQGGQPAQIDRVGQAAALAEGLALVRELARRTLGMEPYEAQLMGAAALAAGLLAEMQTGEGKTLTAGIAAALMAMAGVPVHVATVNDYLAERDADEMRPLFDRLGLRVGTIVSGMDLDSRRAAYACHVTYCTGKELVFDYLKDRAAVGPESSQARQKLGGLLGAPTAPLLLRGLHFAIIDEADSIFIDEARTPLILSEKAGAAPDDQLYVEALALARQLREGEHYLLRQAHRELLLTPAGRQWLTEHCLGLGREWTVRTAREQLASQALRALHLFHRDQHYIVRDDEVQIVDEQTGRALPGRVWEQALHQMVECKEGCAYSDATRTLARITYQRFFRRYLRLSGMTGTAQEVRGELWRVYELETVVIPTHRPSQRRLGPTRCLPTEADKWHAIAERARQLAGAGRAVLVGTRSVEASERLSAVLTAQGVVHRVLNARQDADEAALVRAAGEPGTVTVATNMAGRGTDIKPPPEVKALGGLHVILSEFHESARVDRQLFGRAARQGDPGSAEAIVCLQDAIFRHHAPGALAQARQLGAPGRHHRVIDALRRSAQRRAEAIHARTRAAAMKHDQQIETLLCFSGKN
jgi:preprotein translocase subunit SecA